LPRNGKVLISRRRGEPAVDHHRLVETLDLQVLHEVVSGLIAPLALPSMSAGALTRLRLRLCSMCWRHMAVVTLCWRKDLTIWSWLRPVARPTAIVLGLALGAGGCTALPGSGPWMGGAQSGSTEALPFDVIDLTPTTVVAYRQPESPDRPTSVASNLSAAVHIAIAPGDSLKVRIFERYGGNIFRPSRE
jgi:hypothetical protein